MSLLGKDKLGVGRSPKGLLGNKPECGGPWQITFGGSCSPQVVDGSQDEPAGFLLIRGDAQRLHGRLQLTELLSCLLLLLRLQGQRGTLAPDLRGCRLPLQQTPVPSGRARLGESPPAEARLLAIPMGHCDALEASSSCF